jgi:hypothetical protein
MVKADNICENQFHLCHLRAIKIGGHSDGEYNISFDDTSPEYSIVENVPTFLETHGHGSVKVFPNPASQYITIDPGDLTGSTVLVVDTGGKTLFEKKNVESAFFINIRQFMVSGYCLVKISNEQTREVFKIMADGNTM